LAKSLCVEEWRKWKNDIKTDLKKKRELVFKMVGGTELCWTFGSFFRRVVLDLQDGEGENGLKSYLTEGSDISGVGLSCSADRELVRFSLFKGV
jgi:hypothetical protein